MDGVNQPPAPSPSRDQGTSDAPPPPDLSEVVPKVREILCREGYVVAAMALAQAAERERSRATEAERERDAACKARDVVARERDQHARDVVRERLRAVAAESRASGYVAAQNAAERERDEVAQERDENERRAAVLEDRAIASERRAEAAEARGREVRAEAQVMRLSLEDERRARDEAERRAERAELLLNLYRTKAAVDGLNGRPWDARVHLAAVRALAGAGETVTAAVSLADMEKLLDRVERAQQGLAVLAASPSRKGDATARVQIECPRCLHDFAYPIDADAPATPSNEETTR